MSRPSVQRVAARYLVGRRGLFYHGTSSRHLRRILKEGLLPVGMKGVGRAYEESEVPSWGSMSMRTFGGVYLTESVEEAYSYAQHASEGDDGEHFLIVMVTVETRSPGVLLDEDGLIGVLHKNGRLYLASDLLKPQSPWLDALKRFAPRLTITSLDPTDEAVQRVIQREPINEFVGEIIDLLVRMFPRAKADIDRQPQRVEQAVTELVRALGMHLLEAAYELRKKEGLRVRMPPVGRRIEPPTGTFRLFMQAVDGLLRLLPNAAEEPSEKWGPNIRFPRPITYRGKNRILTIVEVWFSDVGDDDPIPEHAIRDLILQVRYGSDYKPIFEGMKDTLKGTYLGDYRILDAGGRVIEEGPWEWSL